MSQTLTAVESANLHLHKSLVLAALVEVIHVSKIHGVPSNEVVNKYYSSLSPRAKALLIHKDPLGLAFDLAADDAPPPSDDEEHYRANFDEVSRKMIETISQQARSIGQNSAISID
jgi:hypothetical protein